MTTGKRDQDIHKGAIEDDSVQKSEHNTSMRGQNAHRHKPEMLEGTDSDYPEPGGNPEHTGEPEEDPEQNKDVQSSGERQKTNQNWRNEDPLAS